MVRINVEVEFLVFSRKSMFFCFSTGSYFCKKREDGLPLSSNTLKKTPMSVASTVIERSASGVNERGDLLQCLLM